MLAPSFPSRLLQRLRLLSVTVARLFSTVLLYWLKLETFLHFCQNTVSPAPIYQIYNIGLHVSKCTEFSIRFNYFFNSMNIFYFECTYHFLISDSLNILSSTASPISKQSERFDLREFAIADPRIFFMELNIVLIPSSIFPRNYIQSRNKFEMSIPT